MSIASEISRLQTAKADLKTSIESKGVTVPSSAKLDDYADYVDSIQTGGGGGGSATDPVRFIDYDGTILYSYSASEFAALTAMPANPTHTGLTSQGWNWSLAEAKAQVTAMGSCNIGQMYVTSDGKTRIYISLTDSTRLSPFLGICPNGTVVVDWGDNSSTDTLTGTSLTTVQGAQHTYASTGDYVITLTVSSGTFALYYSGSSAGGTKLLCKADFVSFTRENSIYQNCIKRIELGNSISGIGVNAFGYCYSLESITIPSGVTSIGNYAFQYCYSLASITIPSGVTSMGQYAIQDCKSLESASLPNTLTTIPIYAFRDCLSLKNITIPSGVTSIGTFAFNTCSSLENITIPSGVTSIGASTFSSCNLLSSITIPNGVTSIGSTAFANCFSLTSITIPSGITSIGNSLFSSCNALTSITIPSDTTSIGNSAFQYCYGLASITIPSSVTSIGTQSFSACYGVAEYHLLPTTPPTLDNTNAFTGILSDCKIYVPAASLTAYQEATNWSEYASYMVGE